TGGRKREFLGDCWDHFAVIFYYPNDIVVSFNSHQSGLGYDDIMCRVYGLRGTADTHYFGNVTVTASVRSNLTTILGRMAAYRNSVVTWDEMMRRKEKFTPDLKGLKA